MTNRQRFLAGQIFSVRGSEVLYKFNINEEVLRHILIYDPKIVWQTENTSDSCWKSYGGLRDIDIDKFTAFNLYFNQLVYINIRFDQLIFGHLQEDLLS